MGGRSGSSRLSEFVDGSPSCKGCAAASCWDIRESSRASPSGGVLFGTRSGVDGRVPGKVGRAGGAASREIGRSPGRGTASREIGKSPGRGTASRETGRSPGRGTALRETGKSPGRGAASRETGKSLGRGTASRETGKSLGRGTASRETGKSLGRGTASRETGKSLTGKPSEVFPAFPRSSSVGRGTVSRAAGRSPDDDRAGALTRNAVLQKMQTLSRPPGGISTTTC